MKNPIITVSLLLFVVVSFLFAIADIAGWRQSSSSTESDNAVAEHATQTTLIRPNDLQFTAICFHAPHRCPTCETIEAFAHDALASEIEEGNIAWKTADYTADGNKSIVEKCKVFTSTVVLVDQKDGEVLRWRNLEKVWDHTNDPKAFETFIDESWAEFRSASSR